MTDPKPYRHRFLGRTERAGPCWSQEVGRPFGCVASVLPKNAHEYAEELWMDLRRTGPGRLPFPS